MKTIALSFPPAPAVVLCDRKEEAQDARPAVSELRRLLAAVRRGDEAAFNRLHDQCGLLLYQRLLRLTRGNEALARELAQAALLQLARRAPLCDDDAALIGWLLRVARNRWIDLARRESRVPSQPLDDLDVAAGPTANPLDEPLKRALAELPPDDRELLQARYLDRRALSGLAAERGPDLQGARKPAHAPARRRPRAHRGDHSP
ncbi:MAG: sigma-70 family RNA polymerase sigma factor [Verrucomicrobiota bacterium]